MGINENINLSFVIDLLIAQDYIKVNDSKWMLKRNNIFIDYSLSEKQTGILGKKTVSFQNYIVNKCRHDSNGKATTHILDGNPYIEASIGVTNILKFFRVDLIKRLNYLDEKYEVTSLFGQRGLTIRFSAKFDF